MTIALVSRYLTPTDRHQRMSIKLTPEDYQNIPGVGNKWGLIYLNISSIAITNLSGSPISGALGTVDIRPSQYAADNDNIIDNEAITNSPYTNTFVGGKKYYFAINNGQIGPGAYVEPDGSWDLVDIKYDLPDGYSNDQVKLTVNYTITFTDLTPSGPSAGASNITLHVDNDKTCDYWVFSDSAFAGSVSGYVAIQLASYDLEVADKPDFADPVDLLDVAHKNDSVPLFLLQNLWSPVAYAQNLGSAYPSSKASGHRNFDRALWIFAVNGGKIDANGTVGHGFDRVNLLRADLCKVWACDDVVDLKLNYDITRSLA